MSKKNNGKYCILALDGGGVRSVIEITILQRIIQVYPNFLDNVDLIAGVSAGGILALDLATGQNNIQVGEFFKNIVPQIFHKSWIHEFTSLDSAIAPSYTNETLKQVLTNQFGDLTLKDLPKKVLIPSFQLDNHSTNSGPIVKPTDSTVNSENSTVNNNNNIETSSTTIATTTTTTKVIDPDEDEDVCDIDSDFEFIHHCSSKHNIIDSLYTPPITHHRRWAPRFFHNLHHSKTEDHTLVDVALRTSAAPTYFPIYQGFVDGGVYANNPSLCAVTTAISSGIQMKDIVVLSLSTGRDGKYVSPDQYGNGNWGLAQWAPTLINMLLDSNVEISDFQCSQLLGNSYHRVDPLLTKNIDLDQPKFIPLLEEIANSVDLTSTFEWIENFWLKEPPTSGPKPSDNKTPPTTPVSTPLIPTVNFKNPNSDDTTLTDEPEIISNCPTVDDQNTTTSSTKYNYSCLIQ